MKWRILLITGVSLAGCSAQPPLPDPFEGLRVEVGAATPVPVPDWPAPMEFTEGTVTFDLEGARRLEAYREVSLANHEIAEANAVSTIEMQRAFNAAVDMGSEQRRIAELRQQIINQERQHHFWEKVTAYAVAFFGLLFAVAN